MGPTCVCLTLFGHIFHHCCYSPLALPCQDNLRGHNVPHELASDFTKSRFFERLFHQHRTTATKKVGHPAFGERSIRALKPGVATPILLTHIHQHQSSPWFQYPPELVQYHRYIFQRRKVKHVTIVEHIKRLIKKRQLMCISFSQVHICITSSIDHLPRLGQHPGGEVNGINGVSSLHLLHNFQQG